MKKCMILMLTALMLLPFASCSRKARDIKAARTEILRKSAEQPTQTLSAEDSVFAVFNGEVYVEIPLILYASYSEEDEVLADGMGMFSSLDEIIRRIDPPVIVYTDAYDIRYAEKDGWETAVGLAVYRYMGEYGYEPLPAGTEASSLEPGIYVMDYSYRETKNKDYSYSSAIFWLIVE